MNSFINVSVSEKNETKFVSGKIGVSFIFQLAETEKELYLEFPEMSIR
jgi:hypothetical protein